MTEREWREASDMQASTMNLAMVLLAAATLRFWSLGDGIPYALGGEERTLMGGVVGMIKAGTFKPPHFEVGGLLYYVHLPLVVVQFLLGAVAGRWTALAQVSAADFHAPARALTALGGTATVFLVYQVGLRWGARHALLGAGLLAVMPLHVQASQTAQADAPATLLVTLTLLFTLIAHEKGTARAFAWAGAAAGLAAATKYSAGLVLVAPLVAAWMTLHAAPTRARCAALASAAFAAAFLVSAPYTLLALPEFLDGVSAHAYAAHLAAGAGRAPAWQTAWEVLRGSLGWPATILLAVGVLLGIVRAIKGPGRVRWTVLLAFGALWFAWLTAQPALEPRAVLPLLPVACTLAAIAVLSGVSLLRRFDIPRTPRRALIAGLTVAALLPPLVRSIAADRERAQRGTREAAYLWLLENVPAGQRVAVERQSLSLPAAYQPLEVGRLVDLRPDDYARRGVTYFVASSEAFGPVLEAPHRHSAEYAAYNRLFHELQVLHVVTPARGRPGPELRVLKRRDVYGR